jgi:tetratricopeptide (TPR) repeat protein
LYAQSPLLLEIADAHRRLGFSLEAVRLYQQVAKTSKNPSLLETSLIGLGRTYLDQEDPQAARKVLERYRFQFPTGRYESAALELLVEAMAHQQDYQRLLHLCRNWLLHHPRHPDRPQMYLRLAATLVRLEQTEEAALAYEEAFKAGAPQTTDRLLAYADTLSRLNRHRQAIAAYRAVLDKKPPARQAEWAQLQTARHWYALKQYDRATVALAELGQTDDAIINRYVSAFQGSLQAARRHSDGEGL